MLTRLNPTDEMLDSAAGTVGSQRRIQLIWVIPQPASLEHVAQLWERLAQGSLSRTPQSPILPFARRWWQPATNTEAPFITPDLLEAEDVHGWLDEQVNAHLNTCKLWRLAAARTGQQTTVVSLVVPHAMADGLGLINAVTESKPDTSPAHRSIRSDFGDLVDQLQTSASDLPRWARRVASDRTFRRSLIHATRSMMASGSPPIPSTELELFTTAFFSSPSSSWNRAANAAGTSANGLYISIAERLYRAVNPTGPVDIGIPVSLRAGTEDRAANALVVVPLHLEHPKPSCPRMRDAIRQRLDQITADDTTLIPQLLWNCLPARGRRAFKTPGAQQTDIIASNFGNVTPAAHALSSPAESMFARTMSAPGLDPKQSRIRLSICLIEVGASFHLTVTASPTYFGSTTDITALVSDILATMQIEKVSTWPKR